MEEKNKKLSKEEKEEQKEGLFNQYKYFIDGRIKELIKSTEDFGSSLFD